MEATKALLVAAALVATGLAGCIASQVEQSSLPLPTPEEVAPLAYRYVCPGESSAKAEPCLGWIARQDAFLMEPYVAADPRDPAVFAVGVNMLFPASEMVTGAPAMASPMMRVQMFFTEDGGRSWRETVTPTPEIEEASGLPTPVPFDADPAFVFDARGSVHATGLVHRFAPHEAAMALSGALPHGDARVFYVRSDDRGRSWEEPIALSLKVQGHQDRNWITYDPARDALYVVWHNTGPEITAAPVGALTTGIEDVTTEIAWSLDGGDTWNNWKPAQWLPCYLPARPVVIAGEVLLGCARANAGADPSVRVYAFSPETGDAEFRSELTIPAGQDRSVAHFINAFPSGRLSLYAVDLGAVENGGETDTFLSFSGDAGKTWSEPRRLTGLLGISSAHAWWGEADPTGGLHFLVQVDNPARAGSFVTPAEIHHAVLDEDGNVLHDVRVDPEDRAAGVCYCRADHFYGIGWSGDRLYLAFTVDAKIAVAPALALS